MPETNWAGTQTYRASAVHRPTSMDELRRTVAGARSIRAAGTRHTFNDITDAAELISLERMPGTIEVDGDVVTCPARMTYGELALALEGYRLALANLASLPHINIAGAIATGTHGSGDALGSLATAVCGLELVTSDGDDVWLQRGDDDFAGAVVGLGALGIVTRIQLETVPAYDMRQDVIENVDWETFTARFDEIFAAGASVSAFTTWGSGVEQIWIKSREQRPPKRFGGTRATVHRHPVRGNDATNCTPQLGIEGPWYDRLPHFRSAAAPSSAGEEIQSEYLIARRDALAAIDVLRAAGDRIRSVLQISEIRTMAADDLWMSPAHGRDSVGVHFTWTKDPREVDEAIAVVEDALSPFEARPHWGKRFGVPDVALRYPSAADFVALAERLDARGVFRNAWHAKVFD